MEATKNSYKGEYFERVILTTMLSIAYAAYHIMSARLTFRLMITENYTINERTNNNYPALFRLKLCENSTSYCVN